MAVTISGSTPTFSVATGYAGGTITSGTAQASTSGTSITFTGIPTWTQRITVMFNGVSTSGTSMALVRLGTSGGLATTGYTTVGSIQGGGAAAGSSGSAGIYLWTNNPIATDTRYGTMVFTLLNSSSNLWVATGMCALSNTNQTIMFAGGVSLSGAITQLAVTTANGTDTFDAGSINILYE